MKYSRIGASLGQHTTSSMERWSLAIHGGAGVINSSKTEWLDDAKRGLEASLRAGQAVLSSGGSAIDAVVAAVMSLEDDPHFNAGAISSSSSTLESRTHSQLSRQRHHTGALSPRFLARRAHVSAGCLLFLFLFSSCSRSKCANPCTLSGVHVLCGPACAAQAWDLC